MMKSGERKCLSQSAHLVRAMTIQWHRLLERGLRRAACRIVVERGSGSEMQEQLSTALATRSDNGDSCSRYSL